MSFAEQQRRMKEALKLSEDRAKKLTAVGMQVSVLRDNGTSFITKLESHPWQLGHGAWVAEVEGIRGGYDCARITPVEGSGS